MATVNSFNVKLKYVKGRDHQVADVLSRIKDWPEIIADKLLEHRLFAHEPVSEESTVVYKYQQQLNLQIATPLDITCDPITSHRLLSAQTQDTFCQSLKSYLVDDDFRGVPEALQKEILITASSYLVHNAILYKIDTKQGYDPKQLLVLPKTLVPEVLDYYHESKGHPGIKQMIKLL